MAGRFGFLGGHGGGLGTLRGGGGVLAPLLVLLLMLLLRVLLLLLMLSPPTSHTLTQPLHCGSMPPPPRSFPHFNLHNPYCDSILHALYSRGCRRRPAAAMTVRPRASLNWDSRGHRGGQEGRQWSSPGAAIHQAFAIHRGRGHAL